MLTFYPQYLEFSDTGISKFINSLEVFKQSLDEITKFDCINLSSRDLFEIEFINGFRVT